MTYINFAFICSAFTIFKETASAVVISAILKVFRILIGISIVIVFFLNIIALARYYWLCYVLNLIALYTFAHHLRRSNPWIAFGISLHRSKLALVFVIDYSWQRTTLISWITVIILIKSVLNQGIVFFIIFLVVLGMLSIVDMAREAVNWSNYHMRILFI